MATKPKTRPLPSGTDFRSTVGARVPAPHQDVLPAAAPRSPIERPYTPPPTLTSIQQQLVAECGFLDEAKKNVLTTKLLGGISTLHGFTSDDERVVRAKAKRLGVEL